MCYVEQNFWNYIIAFNQQSRVDGWSVGISIVRYSENFIIVKFKRSAVAYTWVSFNNHKIIVLTQIINFSRSNENLRFLKGLGWKHNSILTNKFIIQMHCLPLLDWQVSLIVHVASSKDNYYPRQSVRLKLTNCMKTKLISFCTCQLHCD